MPLILHGLAPLHWALAGAGIAAVTLALLFLANRRLGISGGLDELCSLAISTPYFQRQFVRSNRPWRLPFLIGLVFGGFLSAVMGGGWTPSWSMGLFDEVIGLGPAGKTAWMFAGGLLIGFGTRLANGCTSGHGIFGVSNFEWPSLLSTVSFMGAGLATTHVLYRIVFSLGATQ
jgi:uncharacterized membrane protein YedE/YeeE